MKFVIFLICFFYAIYKLIFKNINHKTNYSKNNIIRILDNALKNNGFTEKRTFVVNSYYKLFRSDSKGENYIFAICNETARFLIPDIISINEEAKKVHIHNVVIINQMRTPYPEKVERKIKEYGMELWDLNKLTTMSKVKKISDISDRNSYDNNDTYIKSVLKTSDTSDDKCKIDIDSYDPIQDYSEKKSILDKLFRKTDKL